MHHGARVQRGLLLGIFPDTLRAPMTDTPHRCGFVTLVGRPNVGKSTLLNRLLGEKVAITSPRPQTTRNRIPGVLTRPGAQLVFVDTPGIHKANRALNDYMVVVSSAALFDTDVLVLLVEAGVGHDLAVGVGQITEEILGQLRESPKPVVLVLNKIDRIEREHVLPVIDRYRSLHDFAAIVPISALNGDNVEALLGVLLEHLPEGPALYPEDALTDLPERFIAAETVREKLFRNLQREVPYSIAVTVDRWTDREGAADIEATIHVERDSQKGIVIGKGGAMLKKVGTQARQDLERLLGTRVHLRLFVRVESGWTRTAGGLRKLGYE